MGCECSQIIYLYTHAYIRHCICACSMDFEACKRDHHSAYTCMCSVAHNSACFHGRYIKTYLSRCPWVKRFGILHVLRGEGQEHGMPYRVQGIVEKIHTPRVKDLSLEPTRKSRQATSKSSRNSIRATQAAAKDLRRGWSQQETHGNIIHA